LESLTQLAAPLHAIKSVQRLPNVGRESHTYLHHIITNYESLPELLLFLPGNSLTHPWRVNTTKELLRRVSHIGGACCKRNDDADAADGPLLDFKVDHWTCTDPQNLVLNTDGSMQTARHRPLRQWVSHHFGVEAVRWAEKRRRPSTCYNGVLAVHRSQIQLWPVAVYQKILTELSEHHNPEVNHYMERLWMWLWGSPHIQSSASCDNFS
jgi:hypothetical protein